VPATPPRPAVEPEKESHAADAEAQGVSEAGLDWGDVSLIRAKLELTPGERLQAAQDLLNAANRIRALNAGRG